MRMVGWVAFVGVVSLSALGCATSFTGSAYVENGRNGCEAKCRGQGMQVAGMVYMGEYSSACVCEVPRATSSIGGGERHLIALSGGAMGSAAGVIMQMQRQQQQMQQSQMMVVH